MTGKRKAYGGSVRIPRGAKMPTCPQGHSTCFPRACPVCRAMATPYEGGLSPQHRRAIGRGVRASHEPQPIRYRVKLIAGWPHRVPVEEAK